jgi:hypothetical protein
MKAKHAAEIAIAARSPMTFFDARSAWLKAA